MIPLRASLKRLLLSEYYGANLLVLTTYIVGLRRHALGKDVEKATPLSWLTGSVETAPFVAVEFQLGAALVSAALIYGYRSTTCDAAVASAAWFARLHMLLMALLVDKAAFVCYAAAFGLVFLLFSHPWHTDSDDKPACEPTSITNLGACRCRHGYTLFADLAKRYTTDKLRFAKLDVGVWPHVGTVADVEVSCVSNQLPSVITYEKGQEDRRVPSTRKNRKHIFSRLDLINGLGLDIKRARSLPARAS
ncbi:hypothetical protein DUNSADRAFT_6673 [Dunaliella salina]|uniref:Encoded protein n=1 Tax=Dunaliella salina TaxID=3046 RepID=A0ABQ7GMS8_DUNSA|nr:hypothetical protein DUNSADRAFT_6673 [Dunaliella salina]|eukprot:KAF5835916.1 hypothetical protein DUNSADRAFT_6673 [Dunaliella salina]